jgi:hypothetical protein
MVILLTMAAVTALILTHLFSASSIPVPQAPCCQRWSGAGLGWLLAGVEDREAGGLLGVVRGNL